MISVAWEKGSAKDQREHQRDDLKSIIWLNIILRKRTQNKKPLPEYRNYLSLSVELLKFSFLSSDILLYVHITVDIIPFILLDLQGVVQRCSPLLSGRMDGWDGCVCAVGVAVAATGSG